MKRNLFLLVGCCSLLALLVTGCYTDIAQGRTRTGMVLSKDKIVSRYERPADQLLAAAKEVLKFNGTLTFENTIAKTLQAKINNETVGVKVEEVEPNISRLTVQARRKSGTADIELASEIDKRIALQLQVH